MCRNKNAIKGSLLLFGALMASAFVSTLISGKAFAATTSDLVAGEDGVRWEYTLSTGELGSNESQKLFISFYDKPADLTTVTVPSLSYLISHISGANSDLDTYFLTDADVAGQDNLFGSSHPRIVTSTPTTVLDMTNTSKIQIRGVKPIIDPDVETELIFGSNMVLGDSMAVRIEGVKCNSFYLDGDNYVCDYNWSEIPYVIEDASGRISGWASMSAEERTALEITPEIVGYGETTTSGTVPANEYDPNKTYFRNRQNGFSTGHGDYKGFKAYKDYVGRAFSGYKLKLTNFKASNFNYVGWGTFKDSIFADDSTTITVDGNSFNGGDIFMNTNVKNIVINTDHYGVGLFRDCQNLENVSFGEHATYLKDDTFAGTNLTGISFEGTNVKRIGARAFEGAQLTQVNFGNMERIDYHAFKDNDIRELYLPKSINYLQSSIFTNNASLKKVTIAYDTLSSGTTLPFWVVFAGPEQCSGSNCNLPLEEVNVIAPYAANEPVSATHVTYDDYRWGFSPYTQGHTGGRQPNNWGSNSYGYAAENTYKFEDDFANYDAYKNILAPLYFATFRNLKKITIGEGYEYIGSSAFWYDTFFGIKWPAAQALDGTFNGQIDRNKRYLKTIQLPDTLKGVGNLAFQGSYAVDMEVNLPQSLEFIGVSAFQELYHMGGDFDLPNLKYLGDFAFDGTSLRDITIHDTLEYWGVKAFINDPFVRNITIDCDIFSPDKYVPWATEDYSRTRDSNVIPSNENFRLQFGYYTGEGFTSHWNSGVSAADAERWGIDERSYLGQAAWSHFGKITFTDKVVHMMAMMDHDSDNTSSTDSFFGQTSADEIDMSGMPWKILPRKFFNRIHVGKISLPQNLEIIGHHAFVSTQIDEELVIPDSVKIIGSHAFEQKELAMAMKNCTWNSVIRDRVCERDDSLPTIKITKLPTSLEYVGNVAFWGDLNMTADLNAPNLKYIGSNAFMYSGIRDVVLPNGLTMLREGAFAIDANLRNITIDTNLSDIYTTAAERHGPDDYAFPSYFIEWAGNVEEARIEIDTKALTSNCEWFDEQMANGYFDQHPEKLQYQSKECLDDKPFETFYTIFNKQEEVPEYYLSYHAIKVKEGQIDSGDTYGTLTFGPHATADLNNTSDGVFAGLNFDTVDLSQAGWKSLSTHINAFYKSKIGTIILPNTIETINSNAFQRAEVTNPITFPASLRKVDTSAFQWAKIGGLNIEEGLEEIKNAGFLWSEIGGEFALPSTLKTLEHGAFMESKGHITNMLPEGVEFVGDAAFYQTDMADELTIPSTVTTIQSSAFNAKDVDVHYDKVTIKPDLTNSSASGQLVHQLLWHVDLDELVVESSMLVGLERYADTNGNQEFYNMPMDKVTITSLPTITYGAFDKCSNLVEVDMSQNANLRDIKTEAFLDAEKLHIIKFSPALKNETVNVGQRAFVNTAFETMGDKTKEFDLTAAKFNATPQGLAFAWMPKLRTLDIPRNFSNNTVPVATFYNDTNLEEVTVDYKITLIDNGAFVNDTKIKKIFIWGNTVVKNDSLEGYTAPEWFGQGGDDDDDTDADPVDPVNPATLTIPGQADIYAYSVSPTEAYADFTRSKPEVTGVFYPLDEVLYLTSNKPTVLLNDDESDFDKSDLIVYGLRRDGLVLESDEWAQYDGVVYPRSARPLTFEKMAATVAADPAFGTVYDTPVPLNELNIGNENFAAIDFAIVPAQDDPAVRIVNIVYTDGYTGGEPDTDIDPRQVTPDPTPVIPDGPDDPVEPDNPVNPDEPEPQPEPQPEPEPEPQPEPETPEEPEQPEKSDTPVTNDDLGKYIAILTGSFAAGLGLIGWKLLSSRKRR